MQESFLDEGFILDKRIGVGQPKRIENAKILVANTAMDTDKIKIYGARVRVDSMAKVSTPVFRRRHGSAWQAAQHVLPTREMPHTGCFSDRVHCAVLFTSSALQSCSEHKAL